MGMLLLAGPLAPSAHADVTVVPLGTASAFSVLAGSAVTNTGTTEVARSVGLHPGTAVTGHASMTVGGTYHVTDAVARDAKTDLTTAYDDAAGQTPPIPADEELGGETLVAGVYNRAAEMGLTGVLTLDGQNDPDSVWVFQAGTKLTVAGASRVELINGADPCNVFWQVGSSATLGTTSAFIGTVMADQSITMKAGAALEGRVLARSGSVTLDDNEITTPGCDGDVEVADGTSAPPSADGTGGSDGAGGTGGTGGTGGGTDTGKSGKSGKGAASGSGTPTVVTSDPSALLGADDGTGVVVETQVSTMPIGAVDTGKVAPREGSGLEGVTGWLLAAGFGALALFAVRRRRLE